jgi:hypothetical protein
MRTRPLIGIALTLILGLAGCAGPSAGLPTAPTSAPSSPSSPSSPVLPTSPSTVAGERWNLTTTLSSATGPEGCVVGISHMRVGDSYGAWQLAIERSGESVHLVVFDSGNPSDRYQYDGTIVGGLLTVPPKSFSSAGWCGGRVEFTGENSVLGRFSEDGHALTAQEVDSLRLSTGEIVTLHYDWRATQP